MPSRWGTRPLKAWRYIGVWSSELMLCIAQVRIGRARQSFWGLWDRATGRLYERSWIGRGGVRFCTGRARVRDGLVAVELSFAERPGIETVCASGSAFGWTRKQGGVPVVGVVELPEGRRELEARGLIDDTAAYYQRHTRWRWAAGVGVATDGRELAWNLVSGVNDPPASSERTVWVQGAPEEVGPCTFASDLRSVDQLRFDPEAELAHRQNLLVLRSAYRQPFGTFSGRLTADIELAEAYGVMEDHEVWW